MVVETFSFSTPIKYWKMLSWLNCWNISIQYSELEPQNDEDLPLPVRVARGSAFALWPLSKSAKNKLAIQNAGGLSLLARYFKRSQSYFYKWNWFTTCGIHFIMYNNCNSDIIFQTCSHEANLRYNSSNRNIAGTFLNFIISAIGTKCKMKIVHNHEQNWFNCC